MDKRNVNKGTETKEPSLLPLVGGLVGAGKEMMEGSDQMSSFIVSDCAVSGGISGGGNYVDAVVGDPACAASVDCQGGMTITPALDTAA